MGILRMFGFGKKIKKEKLRRFGSRQEFQSALYRETARANRQNSKLSLILINKSENVLEYLVSAAYLRLRLSDEIGWHSADKFGLLLPDTSIEGAEYLVKNLNIDCIKTKNSKIIYEIYSYPSPEWPVDI